MLKPPPIVVSSPQYFWRLHWRLQSRSPMWVVYRPTTQEYPGRWVTRMWLTLPAERSTRFVMTHDTLAELRDLLPPGVFRLERYENDAPEIEEVWI